ncbi:MAG: BON domain-containing protein [Gammaproteobacteria bacterium]
MKLNHGILALLIATNLLYGCAPVVIGGAAAGTAVVANSRRSPGSVVDDETIELKARLAIIENKELNSQVHVEITSYNGIILLTGQAPNEQLRTEVENIVKKIPEVQNLANKTGTAPPIHNEITIAAPSSFMTRTSDSLVTAKVKTELLGITDIEGFNGTRVKVITENGTVYLMGLLTHKEADAVTEKARQVGGVQRVVKLFEYID